MSRTKVSKFPKGANERADIFISDKVSYLSQRPMILSCTLQENIVLERQVDNERLDWALKCADLQEDMKNSDNGLMTMVGESGATLSGGQRTRLALARNLYRGGEVYLFDDPLSALDINVGSLLMQETICKELKSKTVVITTHAIQYSKFADRIIIMDNGRIVSDSTYDEVKDTVLFKNLAQEIEEKAVSIPCSQRSIVNLNDSRLMKSKAKLGLSSSNINASHLMGTSINVSKSVLFRHSFNKTINDMDLTGDSIDEAGKERSDVTEEEEAIDQFFLDEDREKGSISCAVMNNFSNMVGGKTFLFGWLILIASGPVIRIYRNAYLLDWSKDLDVEDKWTRFWLWSL